MKTKKYFLPFALTLLSFNANAYYVPPKVNCNFSVVEIYKEDAYPPSSTSFSGSMELEKEGSRYYKSWQDKGVEIEVTVDYLDHMYTDLKFRRDGKSVFHSRTATRANKHGAYSSTINGYGNYVSDVLRDNDLSVSEALQRDLFKKGTHLVSIFLKCF